jgi:hypothetical protein
MDDLGRGRNQIVMAFEVKESSDLTDDNVLFLKPVTVSQLGTTLSRIQKRFYIHAAIDGCELFSRRSARGDHQIGHRIGDGNHVVATLRGPAFTAAKEGSGGRRLKSMKGRAVNGVNHQRHMQIPRDTSPKESPFRAMGVNNIRLESGQRAGDRTMSSPVTQWMDRSAERGYQLDRQLPCPALSQQVSLGPESGSRD